MSKKILTVLAPVAAIVAFMAVPSLAQAAQVQCGASECANGAPITGQGTQIETKTQNPAGVIHCPSSTATGTLTNNQGSHIHAIIKSFTLPQNCTTNGVSSHITTSASATHPWQLQIQEPVGGQITGHLSPNSQQQYIEFIDQIQVFGGSVATCTFGSHGLQLMGTAQDDNLSVEGTNQFTLIAASGFASSECGTVGTTTGHLTGSFQLEAGSSAIAIHA